MKSVCLICFLLFSIRGLTQSIDLQPYVEGYLFDADRKEPIPFATIKVKGWAKGVVTNRNGSFKIPKKFGELNDTLVVSSMGYDSKVLLIGEMMTKASNIIFLQSHVYGMDEAVVYAKKKKTKNLSAKAIVRKAIRRIPDNFPTQPFSLTGYYRDYQWFENNYLNLNEAILSIYDLGFDSKDDQSTKVALHDIVRNENFPRDSLSSKPYDYKEGSKILDMARLNAYGGNEFRILRIHDAIRNYETSSYAFMYKLKSEFLNSHRFQRGKDIFFDDLPFYNITFTKSQNNYVASGHLLIDKQDFSIYKLYYSLYSANPEVRSGDGSDASNSELIFEVESEYRPFKDQMFLNYITFNNRFLLPKPPRFYLERLIVNYNTERLSLTFNNWVEKQQALKNNNYNLIFLGESLSIQEVAIDVLKPNVVYLYPAFESRDQARDFYRYFKHYEGNKEALAKLLCYVTDVTDVNGNLVNKIYDYKEYRQFREFFTQEVRHDFELPVPKVLIHKNAPIFESQPLLIIDDLENYWMNTPLKSKP